MSAPKYLLVEEEDMSVIEYVDDYYRAIARKEVLEKEDDAPVLIYSLQS